MSKIIRILRSCSMKIFSKFPIVNISKLNFWLVICIAKNFIWTTINAIWSTAFEYALWVLINSQHATNMHANKQLVNSEHWSLNYNILSKQNGLGIFMTWMCVLWYFSGVESLSHTSERDSVPGSSQDDASGACDSVFKKHLSATRVISQECQDQSRGGAQRWGPLRSGPCWRWFVEDPDTSTGRNPRWTTLSASSIHLFTTRSASRSLQWTSHRYRDGADDLCELKRDDRWMAFLSIIPFSFHNVLFNFYTVYRGMKYLLWEKKK